LSKSEIPISDSIKNTVKEQFRLMVASLTFTWTNMSRYMLPKYNG
jgi:hypothetical protein